MIMFEDFEGILKNSTKMSPGGHPYKKGRGVLIRTFWGFSKSGFGASKSVQPQEVHTGAFAVPIKILGREKYDRKNVTLELVPLRSEKHFRSRPQNRILVFFRASLQNFRRASSSFYYMEVPRCESCIGIESCKVFVVTRTKKK